MKILSLLLLTFTAATFTACSQSGVAARQQAISSAQRNPTRHELVERIEQLIADYNAGSVNIDEYLRRLIELSKTLTEEEKRAVREGLTEEDFIGLGVGHAPEVVCPAAVRRLKGLPHVTQDVVVSQESGDRHDLAG